MEKYNGWTNYATWRVNLELVDEMEIDATGMTPDQWRDMDNYDRAHHLEDIILNYMDGVDGPEWVRDFALAFMADVNWYEIANHCTERWCEE